MKNLKLGDKLNLVCEKCQSTTMGSYQLRDVPFNDGSGVVKSLLVGVCDICYEVSSIPHQSVPAIKKHLVVQSKIAKSSQ
jgi:hypothetical protein